ncbi:MAG: cytochrome c [Ectothiorhodospiraceae bacterium]|nr:cytochrome c [Ectothiorhodospiraceae bacterium]
MPLRAAYAFLLYTAVLVLPVGALAVSADADEQIVRGEYLARAANCMGCHTAHGGEPYAGGRRLGTEFGTFVAPNITPDPGTGIGNWSRDDFWRAMHHGRRADGSPLYPACPYTQFTQATREDVDAIYAYLRTVPAVDQETRGHDLRIPASVRPLQRVWQRLYFEPGPFEADPEQSEEWNRGAYLVRGLSHCMACHDARDRFGAPRADGAAGGHAQGWYAPSLRSSQEAGLQGWSLEEGVALLRGGRSGDAAMMGPMADIVHDSLQHLTEDDVRAMTEYLRSLPEQEVTTSVRGTTVSEGRLDELMERGQAIYENRCMDCHGTSGQGTVAASALAGNRAVMLNDPTNVIRIIRDGGYPPSTEDNPRPFGMPPFPDLSEADVAAIVTYIRRSWGNDGASVSTATVGRTR